MKEIVLNKLDQSIFYKKLDNGLEVVLIPYDMKNNYYASYTTKYGSVNLNFIPKGEKEMFNSAKGIAHFLEHKMFEQEDGEDPFNFFSKSGTGSNAGTSYNKTSYYIYGVNELESNLDYLIKFVNEPYFTDENVEKEKGIIIEEIKMYDDNHDWILTEEIQKSTFKNHPIRYDIAGYVDTVSSITKEDLYKCYDVFYQPSNMLLVVAGKFDKDKILNIIEKNASLNSRMEKVEIQKEKIDEPVEINEKYKEISLGNVMIPKIAINVKVPIDKKEDKYEFCMYVSALVSLLYGKSSLFKQNAIKEGYVNYINCDKSIVDDYLVIEFYAEGGRPKELLSMIEDTFSNEKINKEELERYKKVILASTVMESDNVEALANRIENDFVTWGKVIENRIDLIKGITYDKLLKIRKKIDISNNCTVVIKSK